jgi:hypothetical protein
MTDRQRAFISALVYVVKHDEFNQKLRIGVTRTSHGKVDYAFNGCWLGDLISVIDDQYNRVYSYQFYKKPWAVEFTWQGSKSEERLKLTIPEGRDFYGTDGDKIRFSGQFNSPRTIKISDRSHGSDFYYRVE